MESNSRSKGCGFDIHPEDIGSEVNSHALKHFLQEHFFNDSFMIKITRSASIKLNVLK